MEISKEEKDCFNINTFIKINLFGGMKKSGE